MPKMKTNRGAAKRFKITATGKVKAEPLPSPSYPDEEDDEKKERTPPQHHRESHGCQDDQAADTLFVAFS